MTFFDAHNHLNDQQFADDWTEIVEQAKQRGVMGMVNNGGDLASSEEAVRQAELVEGVYVAAGIHPEDLPLKADLTEQLSKLRALLEQRKVVAVGELGLDYTLEVEGVANKRAQFELIEPQLAMAEEVGLPVVLHVRDMPESNDCFEDVWAMLHNFPRIRAQFHCWTGSIAQMERVLGRDFYVSFSGIVTYKSAGEMTEVAKMVPSNRYLIETDGPYLVPEPKRTEMRKKGMRNSERRCTPAYVTMTAEKLAELRSESLEKVAADTWVNAGCLFDKIELSQLTD